MDNNIHVALAVYDPKGTYSQHAGVTVTSIFENTKSKVTVHILHDDTLTDLNRERFLNTAKRYGQTIDLINVEEYKNKISDETANVTKHWTIGTLYRLFIPEILTWLDKVIYLDCDIVVNLDIAELWNIDLGDNAIGAVGGDGYEPDSLHERLRWKFNKCQAQFSFNAGVLIMNLKKIRELGNFFTIAVQWLNRHLHTADYTDQDALNSIFKDSVTFIDHKFNYAPKMDQVKNECLSNSIVHFCNILKPWHEFSGTKFEQVYWKAFFKSEWISSCNGGGGGGMQICRKSKSSTLLWTNFLLSSKRSARTDTIILV